MNTIQQLTKELQESTRWGQQLERERDAALAEVAMLKALVADFMLLLEEDDLMIEDSPDGWWDRKRDAIQRGIALAGKEVK